jgi:hypothetical protein
MYIQSRPNNLDTRTTKPDDSPNFKNRKVMINHKDLVGRTLMMELEEDGQHFCSCVVCAAVEKEY